jgi:DNA polymerase-1
VHDTLLLARLLAAGTHDRCSLEACCERYLGQTVNKTEQRSDWSGELSPEQLKYAARDVAVLPPLLAALQQELRKAKLTQVADIETRCLPAFLWLSRSGAPFDREAWRALTEEATREVETCVQQLDALGPAPPDCLPGAARWSWASPADTLKVLRLLGYAVDSTGDEVLAGIDHPIAELLREHRAASKLISGYGPSWLEHVGSDGRIYAAWNQLGAWPAALPVPRPTSNKSRVTPVIGAALPPLLDGC